MATTNNENQRTSESSSKANESVEETIAKVEEALDRGETIEGFEEESQIQPEVVEPEVQVENKTASQSEEEDDEDYELPSTYKKDIRDLVKKLPKGYEELGKSFIKRAKQIEKDRQGFYSDYQSKTAFAARLSRGVEPYLDFWKAKGITPEIGVERAAKLDYLIANDPQAAAKFVMQMANLKKLSLDDDDIELLNSKKEALTQAPPLTQDDIRRVAQEEYLKASQVTAATQENLGILENFTGQKTPQGKDKYPNFKDDDFVRSMEPLVASLLRDPTNNLSFEQAVLAAYVSRGGVIEQGSTPQIPSRNKDNEKVERLKVASTIRPANSSSNSLNLEDVTVPDSIEDTILLAERLLAGRS